MKSLRARIVGWYVGVGVFIVAIVSILAATVLLGSRAHEARRAMVAVAAQIPMVVGSYRTAHPGLDGVESFLRRRFAAQGVIVHVLPGPAGVMPAGRPSMRSTPPRATPLAAHLLAMAIRPIHVRFAGGDAIVLADPRALGGIFHGFGLFVLALAAVVLSASWRIAAVVAEQTLRPLVNTTAALSRFGSGAFTKVPVGDEESGEPADLARAYNSAVDQTTRALAKRDQAEAEMRQFVADAGHQLRTPLTVITGYLSGMLHRARSADERELYGSMLGQARRMKSLIDHLITLARLENEDAAAAETFDVNELLVRVRSGFDEASQRRIAIQRSTVPIAAQAREDDICEALCALIENGLKYGWESPVSVAACGEGRICTLTVADEGPGLAPDELERAFDRFYRGANADGVDGSGLGLSIVRKSVERSGGIAQLRNRASGGLLATITLPCLEIVLNGERSVIAETALLVDRSLSNAPG